MELSKDEMTRVIRYLQRCESAKKEGTMPIPPAFDEKEGAILSAMYEVANGTYDSYTLAQKLSPAAQAGTPPAGLAFTETREAIERLIVRGLVRGQRLSGADGVFFKRLRLTYKGEQAAIQERSRRTEREDVKLVMHVAHLIRGDAEKK